MLFIVDVLRIDLQYLLLMLQTVVTLLILIVCVTIYGV